MCSHKLATNGQVLPSVWAFHVPSAWQRWLIKGTNYYSDNKLKLRVGDQFIAEVE